MYSWWLTQQENSDSWLSRTKNASFAYCRARAHSRARSPTHQRLSSAKGAKTSKLCCLPTTDISAGRFLCTKAWRWFFILSPWNTKGEKSCILHVLDQSNVCACGTNQTNNNCDGRTLQTRLSAWLHNDHRTTMTMTATWEISRHWLTQELENKEPVLPYLTCHCVLVINVGILNRPLGTLPASWRHLM